MADDWRLRVTLAGGSGGLGGMGTRLKARDLARELTRQLGERIAVSRDGDELFLYAATEDAARAAEDAVRGDLDQHDVSGEIELSRWHEEAEDWQPAEAALPAAEEQRAARGGGPPRDGGAAGGRARAPDRARGRSSGGGGGGLGGARRASEPSRRPRAGGPARARGRAEHPALEVPVRRDGGRGRRARVGRSAPG